MSGSGLERGLESGLSPPFHAGWHSCQCQENRNTYTFSDLPSKALDKSSGFRCMNQSVAAWTSLKPGVFFWSASHSYPHLCPLSNPPRNLAGNLLSYKHLVGNHDMLSESVINSIMMWTMRDTINCVCVSGVEGSSGSCTPPLPHFPPSQFLQEPELLFK